MTVQIEAVCTDDDWRDFDELPDRVYAGDARRIRLPAHSLRQRLAAGGDHPWSVWLVRRDGSVVARVAARRVAELTGVDRPVGVVGYFESLPDPEAAQALLRHAVGGLRDQGAELALGPLDGDTWHRYRLSLGPHEEPLFLLEPHNPPWYPDVWEQAGFRPIACYISKRVDDMAAAHAAFSFAWQRATTAGYRFHPLRAGWRDEELERLHALSCRIFPVNPFYTPIGLDDFLALYRPLTGRMPTEFTWFCTDASGRDAGFLFSYPDRAEALRRMGGRRGPLAALAYLLHRRADTLDIKSMGVCPEHRGQGLGEALMHQAFGAGLARGLTRATLCLMHEANRSTGYDGGSGRVIRRYALFQLDLVKAGS